MRLTPGQIHRIRRIARRLAGEQARLRVFGSRLDDSARGGDLDLLLELSERVANLALVAAGPAHGAGQDAPVVVRAHR